MGVMTIVKAINNALDIKLNEDSSVVVYGEDVGVEGGVFRVTEGLQKKYGVERVFDSPLAESGSILNESTLVSVSDEDDTPIFHVKSAPLPPVPCLKKLETVSLKFSINSP
jgi:hypothetical protein